MSSVLSAMSIADWRGDVTVLRSRDETKPMRERLGVIWSEVDGVVAPAAEPCITPDKSLVRYVLPYALKVAPLVGKTLERALRKGEPTVDKQRSGSHVNPARWVIQEFDGIRVEQFRQIGHSLKASGIAFVGWTTWSYGLPEKPGLRFRLAFPVDEPLDEAAYSQAWHGANERLMHGLADPSGAKLSQQQGTWATDPMRVHLARRWSVGGGVASAQRLIALCPHDRAIKIQMTRSRHAPEPPPALMARQIDAALRAVAATAPEAVIRWAGVPGRILDGEGRERAILGLAGKLHAAGIPQASVEALCRFYNEAALIPPLDEEVVMDRAGRYAGTTVIWPALFAMARDLSAAVVRRAVATVDWEGKRDVWRYLCAYHPKTWAEVYGTTEEAA